LHTSTIYRVYMLGFLPGFAYMGLVDEKISSSRKQNPVTVEAGSIGIAGKQTGIYPLRSPGGWQIIGRTPLKLFDKEKINPVLFKSGDQVQFYSITKDEFEDIKSGNA
jgi:inhibitor of KinA